MVRGYKRDKHLWYHSDTWRLSGIYHVQCLSKGSRRSSSSGPSCPVSGCYWCSSVTLRRVLHWYLYGHWRTLPPDKLLLHRCIHRLLPALGRSVVHYEVRYNPAHYWQYTPNCWAIGHWQASHSRFHPPVLHRQGCSSPGQCYVLRDSLVRWWHTRCWHYWQEQGLFRHPKGRYDWPLCSHLSRSKQRYYGCYWSFPSC